MSVGPLRFGMRHDEAAAALSGFAATVSTAHHDIDQAQKAEFRNACVPAYATAVTAYYGKSEGLFCVVADARYGPQVTLDGVRLVGRVPSQLEQQFLDYMLSRGIAPQYAPEGDPGADELGIIMRVQRAGDVVLSRPVFAVIRERANTLWDGMPYDESQVH
ncbi:hypothetical protein ACIBTZ_26470 [Micromonospora sp. NPDC049460]|uniref:hypothetical protein n=1 Tax=Micromonospora sp. NPDC049460 TaxID=3364272 RepID=UPI003798DFF4